MRDAAFRPETTKGFCAFTDKGVFKLTNFNFKRLYADNEGDEVVFKKHSASTFFPLRKDSILVCGGILRNSLSKDCYKVTFDAFSNRTLIEKLTSCLFFNRAHHRVVTCGNDFFALGGMIDIGTTNTVEVLSSSDL